VVSGQLGWLLGSKIVCLQANKSLQKRLPAGRLMAETHFIFLQ